MIVVNDVLIQQFDDYSERVSVHPHAYEEIAHVFSSNVSPDATAWGKRRVPSPPRSVQQRSAVSLKRIAALLLTVATQRSEPPSTIYSSKYWRPPTDTASDPDLFMDKTAFFFLGRVLFLELPFGLC